MTSPQRIVLTGFMGSGKTTVGERLAQHLRWDFFDLDAEIEAAVGRTVAAIFADQGESEFRAFEVARLGNLLTGEYRVIALGGGAPGTSAVRDLLKATPATAVIHLSAPFDVLFSRCQLQSQDPSAAIRPLLGDRRAAQDRYENRRSLYNAVAHHTVSADLPTPAAVAEEIARILFPVV